MMIKNEELKKSLDELINTNNLNINIANKQYTIILNDEDMLEIKGFGNIWDDNNMLKNGVNENLVEFLKKLENIIDYKKNGIEFTDVWELVVRDRESNNNELSFVRDYLNIDDKSITIAEKLEEMSLESEIELSDDDINNMTLERASEITNISLTQEEPTHTQTLDEIDNTNEYEIGR